MVIGNPAGTIIVTRDIKEARENFYQEFLEKGFGYTKDYLNSFKGLKKFLAEQSLSRESNKYHGAKKALEELSK